MLSVNDFYLIAAKRLRTSRVQVERLVLSAPYRYKHYRIEKKKGGFRDIYHPSPALKSLQRWLVADVLSGLPVHDSVYSYRAGRNIGMHAEVHIRSNYFVRFDYSDFFPSFSFDVISRFLKNSASNGYIAVNEDTAELIARVLCRREKGGGGLSLSIGAPSSPHISNSILYEFDKRMFGICSELSGCYTRYADDIYISSENRDSVSSLSGSLRECSKDFLPYLSFNEAKTQFLSRKRRVRVTGVGISSSRSISIGRDLKRALRTRFYLASRGLLPPEEVASLRGMISHVKSVEPDFVESLVRKFGENLFSEVMLSGYVANGIVASPDLPG